jgi:catechol 2,3-dioxygenase-like lactoylglutathione lyase family enzyme
LSVSTFGLTHLAIGVRDPERAYAFYERVFGMVAVYREKDFIQAQTPGARDVLVFERTDGPVGESGSIAHFGFRLTRPEELHDAVAAVREAGGSVLDIGEFVPGEPYAFVRDVDGYTVEIWYEIPTSADPT